MQRLIVLCLAVGLSACAMVDVDKTSSRSFSLASDLDVIDSQAMIQNQFLDASNDLCPQGYVLDSASLRESDVEWRITCLGAAKISPFDYAAR